MLGTRLPMSERLLEVTVRFLARTAMFERIIRLIDSGRGLVHAKKPVQLGEDKLAALREDEVVLVDLV